MIMLMETGQGTFFFLAGANPLYYYDILTTVLHTHIYQRWSRQASECTVQLLYYSTTTIYSLPYRLLHMFTHICTTHIQIHTCICTTPILLYHHCILTTVPFTTHVYTYMYTHTDTHMHMHNPYTTLPLLYTHYHTVYYTCLHIYVQHTYRYTHAYAQPLYYSTTTVYSLPYRLLHMFTHMYTHTDTHIHIYNPYTTLPPLYTHHTTLWCVCIHMYTHIHYTHTYVHI